MANFSISGLGSGFNYNSLIDQLITLERKPMTLLEDKKQLLTWKKEFWAEMKTSLSALDSSAQALLKRSNMIARTATSSDEDFVTATATSEAALGSYTINTATLATSTKLTGGSGTLGLGIGGTIDPDQAIDSYAAKFATTPTEGKFIVNGVTFELSKSDSDGSIDTIEVNAADGSSIYTNTSVAGLTLNDILIAFNDGGVTAATGVTASYSGATDKFTIEAIAPGGDLNLGSGGDTSNFLRSVGLHTAQRVGDAKESISHLGRVRTSQILSDANFATAITGDGSGNGEFSINGVEITYNKSTDKLQTVLDRINSSAAGVIASYDNLQDKIVLTNKTTGSMSISVADITGNFLEATDALTGATQTVGTNASFSVSGVNDGNPISSLSNTVTDVIPGLTFMLKDEGEATITLTGDNSKAKTAIKDFVDKYNSVLFQVNTKLSEQRVKDASTSFEKQQGLLRGDRELSDLKSKLTNKVTSTIAGLPVTMDQLAEIGITITSDDFGKTGRLEIDETKLDEKLNDNPETVFNLFFNDDNGNGIADAGEDGVAARITSYMDDMIETRGKTIQTRHENTDSAVFFSGSWSTVSDTGASENSVKQSNTTGDYVEYTFVGSAINWYATKGSDQGIAKVYIDGQYQKDVDIYNATTSNKESVYSKTGLSSGVHKIRIEVTASKNAGSSDYNVNVDALDISYTSSSGTVVRQQDLLQSQMNDIDTRLEAMQLRLDKYEENLLAKFSAMDSAIARLQNMYQRFASEAGISS